MQSVEAWLRAAGVSVPVDITSRAQGVNADGSVVAGILESGFAFIARVTPPAQAASLGSLVLNGAHSRPLARRVEASKSCFWTAGDIGRDDHGSRDGNFGLAEVGGCHRFAQGVQGALSVGRASSRQNLVFSGASKLDATYGTVELLANVPGSTCGRARPCSTRAATPMRAAAISMPARRTSPAAARAWTAARCACASTGKTPRAWAR